MGLDSRIFVLSHPTDIDIVFHLSHYSLPPSLTFQSEFLIYSSDFPPVYIPRGLPETHTPTEVSFEN